MMTEERPLLEIGRRYEVTTSGSYLLIYRGVRNNEDGLIVYHLFIFNPIEDSIPVILVREDCMDVQTNQRKLGGVEIRLKDEIQAGILPCVHKEFSSQIKEDKKEYSTLKKIIETKI